ncbi:MAG: phage major capsid protein [Verrucomicrobiota bacterium]
MKKKPLILLSAAVLALAFTGPVLMDISALAGLRRDMATLQAQADKLIADSSAKPGGFTEEVNTQVETILNQIDRLRGTEALLEKNADNAKHLASVPEGQRPDLSLELDGINGEEAKAIRSFSIVKMMLAKVTGDFSRLTPAERYVHDMAVSEAQGRGIDIQGLGIPAAAMKHMRFRNDMSATGGSSGSEGGKLVRTEYRGIILPLVDQAVLVGMGATVLGDLQGNLEMPVITTLSNSSAEPATKSETGSADELTATTTVKTMSPRRLPAVVDVTTQLLRQSSTDVEGFILGDLRRQFSVVVDRQGLAGSGSGQNPTGLLTTAGTGSVAIGTNGGAPTWGKVVALETSVDVANAAMGRLGYLTSKNGKGVLKTTQRVSGQSAMLWENNEINGYHADATNLIPSNLTKGDLTTATALIFGNWADFILGFWGGVDIKGVQDRAQAITGLYSLVMEGFYDILVRRAASFALCKDMASLPA